MLFNGQAWVRMRPQVSVSESLDCVSLIVHFSRDLARLLIIHEFMVSHLVFVLARCPALLLVFLLHRLGVRSRCRALPAAVLPCMSLDVSPMHDARNSRCTGGLLRQMYGSGNVLISNENLDNNDGDQIIKLMTRLDELHDVQCYLDSRQFEKMPQTSAKLEKDATGGVSESQKRFQLGTHQVNTALMNMTYRALTLSTITKTTCVSLR